MLCVEPKSQGMRHQTALLLLTPGKRDKGGIKLRNLLDEEFIPDFLALLEISYHLQEESRQGFAILLHALQRKEQLGLDTQ